MHTSVFAFLVVASITCLSLGAEECDSADVRVALRDNNPEAIKTLEKQWLRAYASRDKALLDCILAKDFAIGSMPEHTLELHDKQHVLQWVETRTGSAELEQLEIKSHATAVVARGIYSVRTDSKIVSRFQFTDFFIRRGNRWQAVSRTLAQLPAE